MRPPETATAALSTMVRASSQVTTTAFLISRSIGSAPRDAAAGGDRGDEAGQQRAAPYDAGELDRLAPAASVVADGAEPIERRHAEPRGEAAVGAAARDHLEDRLPQR